MNVFFLVFLSLLHFLLSFLQHCVLEGGFYERCDQFSDPYFLLLLVGHSSPTSPCVTLNFSHDRSKWPYSSFSSTTLQNTSERNSDSPPPKCPSIILIFVFYFEAFKGVLSLCNSKYICHPSTSTATNAQSSLGSPCYLAATNANGTLPFFFHYVAVLLLMPRVLSAPHVTLLLLMPTVPSHSSFTT